MGISVESVHHEVAPSQQEIVLRDTDALTMADNVMTARLAVKEVAQEAGVYATFMPKPIQGAWGSGMHTHMALYEGERNTFADTDDPAGLSKIGRAFIAGLLKTLYEAVGAMEGSDLLRQALGDHVFEYFIRNKRAEWEAYKAYVSPWEIERSLPIL